MKKVFVYSVITLFFVLFGHAQDIKQAKAAIDAEQYENAKKILETITKSKPSDGYAKFLLGYVYLLKGENELAKKQFDEGLKSSSKGYFNNIGLGNIALDNNNPAEAEKYFALATKNKDIDEKVYIGKAYTYSNNPNYQKAIEVLSLAKNIEPTNTDVLIAFADASKLGKKQNDAYDSYREAFRLDNTLLRAKMGLGTLIKNAHNFPDAVTAFNEVIALKPNYGPVYRELAETHYLWALNDARYYADNMAKGLAFYEKYMSLTDYSLDSRMRHADFLILAKDYKALEKEADEMSKIDKVNPRILRYLGYSAFYNNNFDTAINSLTTYVSTPSNRIIGLDHFYLGASKISKGLDLTPVDTVSVENGMADLKKGYDLSYTIARELSDFGKQVFDKKGYGYASRIYELAIGNNEIKSHLMDNFYFAVSTYWAYYNVEKLTDAQIETLKKADASLDKIILASPTTADAYLFKARIHVLLKNNDGVAQNYENFIVNTISKSAEEIAAPAVKNKLIEAYNNLGLIYAPTDVAKAKENFAKVLELDPANQYAADQLKTLK